MSAATLAFSSGQFRWPCSRFCAAARRRPKVCSRLPAPAGTFNKARRSGGPNSGLPEFGGDLVLASNADGWALIQFDKTPLSMVFAQTTPTRWLIRFPQRQYSFSGHGPAPTRFAWLYLPAALAGKPLPQTFHFERKPDGGWRLENTRTGETLEGLSFAVSSFLKRWWWALLARGGRPRRCGGCASTWTSSTCCRRTSRRSRA